MVLHYRTQRSCGQGNIFAPVCHSVHRGVSASVHAGIPPGADTPPEQRPPQEQTPPEHTFPRSRPPQSIHPPEQTPPEHTPPRSRHPPEHTPPRADPLEQIPPQSRHPTKADTPLPRADTPLREQTPPGSRLRHTVNERPVRILLECILVFFLLLQRNTDSVQRYHWNVNQQMK